MTTTSIRWQERVHRDYDRIHTFLTSNADDVFHSATTSAESLAASNVADLHAKVLGIEVHRKISIEVQSVEDADTELSRKMIVNLQWKAASSEFLFPTMTADLNVFPIKDNETQLDFRGHYEPPLSILGKAVDAIMGQQIAESCVQHFVTEVADYLHKQIPEA